MASLLKKIFEWFFPPKRIPHNYDIVWNKDGVRLSTTNGKGEYHFRDFTGRIKFVGTDCAVEHADFTIIITNPAYLDGTRDPFAPWSALVNRIVFKDGIVVSGKMVASQWQGGVFNGDTLLIPNGFDVKHKKEAKIYRYLYNFG